MEHSSENARWFQFHLSTAVIVMVMAGFLMWGNLVGRKKVARFADDCMIFERDHEYREYGWPFPVLTNEGIAIENHTVPDFALFEEWIAVRLHVVLDVVLALLILFFACLEWERWFFGRRRANGTQATQEDCSSCPKPSTK